MALGRVVPARRAIGIATSRVASSAREGEKARNVGKLVALKVLRT